MDDNIEISPGAADTASQSSSKQVRLGTVAAVGFDDFPAREWLACYRRLGCTTVQAYRNQAGSVSLQEMKDYIEAGEMPCDSLHGVFGEQYDPSSPDEAARRFAVDTYKAEGELALSLGGPLVVVHCSTIRRGGVSDDERSRRVEQLGKSIGELGEYGRGLGVKYAFENLPAYHVVGADIGELASILRDVDAPNTGMCFDTGHALLVGDPAEAIGKADGRVIYVHFSDNSGQTDDHLMPTYGAMDADSVAAALRRSSYRGTLMLEVFHTVEKLKRLIDEGCAERLGRILAIANGKT